MKASFVPPTVRAQSHWLLMGSLVAAALILTLPLTGGRVVTPAPEPEAALAPGEEPRLPAREDDILWTDDFDRHPQRQMVDAGVRPERFGRYVTRDARTLHYDPRGGVNGSGAIRMPWNAATNTGCADDSQILEGSFPATRELVVQFSVRYSPGFAFDWSGRGPCGGNAKKLFLLWAAEGSRFVFIAENGALGVGSDHDHPLFPQNRNVAMSLAALGDGQWHRVTLQIRQASSPLHADGAISGWIDGVQRWEYRDLVTHNGGGYQLFKMPATFNSGSPRAQTEWVDELRIWRVQDGARSLQR